MMERDVRRTCRSIDRRDNARIIRSPLDEVKAIQNLLADIYKDVGDGRTLVRELVQNADDAGAERLVFAVVDGGWLDARNSLLRGSALLVANNGSFPARDRDALHQALGGSKADDTAKVGRFGIGLKSVFHICEAIVYVGAEGGTERAGALNPWAGTGVGDTDPLHPDWDTVDDDDFDRLKKAAMELLGQFDDTLLIWIPLRCHAHLDRANGSSYGLGEFRPTAEEIVRWFGRSDSLMLLVAQCGYLRSIEAVHASAPSSLAARTPLTRVVRPGSKQSRWIGRYNDDPIVSERTFEGVIETNVGNNCADRWSVLGVEALGHDDLRELRSNDDWPIELVSSNGHVAKVPRKALAHAAVTVLRSNERSSGSPGIRVRWAVFLPLDDASDPHTSSIVETVGRDRVDGSWDIVLHGYFCPSHDRRSIPGVTDEDGGEGNVDWRVRWNRGVRDKLLLPLLPAALAQEASNLDERVARLFLEEVAGTRIVRNHLEAVTRRHLLLPIITESGIRWENKPREGMRILSIPAWTKAPEMVRKSFTALLPGQPDNAVFIDNDAPKIGGEPSRWSVDWVEHLLGCVPSGTFHAPQGLRWIVDFVRHVLGSRGSPDDEVVVTVARWIGRRIGEGALAPTADGPLDDTRKDLREVWQRLFSSLPEEWLVDAPVDSQRAVVELAATGVIGEGLLPIPLGRRMDAPRRSHPEPACLDRALLELGRRLAETEGASQRIQRSRLVLAETLLAAREGISLGGELGSLPLLRARRLPDDRDEAWSIGKLRRQSDRRRAFARPSTDADEERDDGTSLEAPSDPKRAVRELSEAVGDATWLVDAAVGATTRAPVPNANSLASAVLCSEAIRSEPSKRQPLLKRLSDGLEGMAGDDRDTVHASIRALLTGRTAGNAVEGELYYVRSQDSERNANQKTLEILLGLLNRPWKAVDPALIEPLPHALVEELRIRTVDAGLLHELLREAMYQPVNWSTVGQSEALHLLRRLFGTTHEKKVSWNAMPLHRGIDGERKAIDGRTRRAAEDRRLPADLVAEIRLLDPDPEVADLYHDVRVLDDDGMLDLMLASTRPWRVAGHIINALRPGSERRVSLPRDPKLLDLLKQAAWLPDRDEHRGIAPAMLLLVPQELGEDVSVLAKGGALGNYRLSDEVLGAVWSAAEDVVREIVGRPSRTRQIQHLARSLKPDRVARIDGGAFLILPKAQQIDISLIRDAFETLLVGHHRGWSLLRAAAEVVGILTISLEDTSTTAQEAVAALARSLCARVPASRQIEMLNTVAESRPAKSSASGRLFRRLLESFTLMEGFFEQVLPSINLPTQDGHWHLAREVARSESGVARRHRLQSDLRSTLRLDGDEAICQQRPSASTEMAASDTAARLQQYFDSWRDNVPLGAVGSFLSLLGRGKEGAITRLAQQWLGDDVSVEGMHSGLFGEDGFPGGVRVFFSGQTTRGDSVEALNLLGERITMEAGTDHQTIFSADPERLDHWRGDFWNPRLGDVETESARNAGQGQLLPFWYQ